MNKLLLFLPLLLLVAFTGVRDPAWIGALNSVPSAGGGPASSLITNLVAYWKLTEVSGNRADSAGSSTLTDNNTVTSTNGHVAATAAQFTLVNSEYLSAASSSTLQMGDIDFTICGWFYLDDNGAGNQMFVTKDDIALNSRDYTLDFNGGIRFYVNGGGGGNNSVTSDEVVANATWYLILAWHDAGANTLNIRVNNGITNLVSTGGLVPQTSAAQFRIGARQYTAFEGYLGGRAEQVGLWKKVLTLTEQTSLWNGGAGIQYPF